MCCLPLSGESAILLLRGEGGLSFSAGKYLFRLPLSVCCWPKRNKEVIQPSYTSVQLHDHNNTFPIYLVKQGKLDVLVRAVSSWRTHRRRVHGVTSVPRSRHAGAGFGWETGGVHSFSLIFERLVFLWRFSFKTHQTN